jgi:hypothetical protein
MLGRRVLRARTTAGIAQEIYALLTVYQAIRLAIADATATVPGTDPDRTSFSIALQAARDQVIQAAGVLASTTIDLTGTIGRAPPWTTSCPRAACASVPRPSSARRPTRRTRASASTAAPTKRRSASTS